MDIGYFVIFRKPKPLLRNRDDWGRPPSYTFPSNFSFYILCRFYYTMTMHMIYGFKLGLEDKIISEVLDHLIGLRPTLVLFLHKCKF